MENQAILRAVGAEPVVLEGVSAKGRVHGLFLELTVEQRYRNPAETNVEAVYTFPLPWGAELMSLEFDIGGKTLSGVIVPRAVGEARYEDAVDQGDTAVLLERAGDDLCTANVGNLMPGEAAVVRYRYAQLLRFEKDQVRIMVPTVIAPRYGDAMVDSSLAPHAVPGSDLLAEYPFSISITLSGELSRGAIASPSHAVEVAAVPEGIEARLARKGFLDRDFVLTISGVRGRSFGAVARDGDGFAALASFCPGIPQPPNHEGRSVKILVDCSGSMAGSSIEAAKRSLHAILSMLEFQDRFSLSRFGSTVQHFHEAMQPVDDETIGQAGRSVMALKADLGGTEMANAIASTLQLAKGTRADVLLITDGEVWAVDQVREAARSSGHRIFAVGIGHAPAENLLRRLAEETGGACELVAPAEDVERAITRMFLRIGQSPASQVRVTWPGTVDWEVPPSQALFDGETLHVFARFAARPAGEAKLSYMLPGGVARVASVALPDVEGGASDLPRMAAAAMLPSVDESEATTVAVRYQLVTEHTNCVLVHERAAGERAADLPQLASVRQMIAPGWAELNEPGIARSYRGPTGIGLTHASLRRDEDAMALYRRGVEQSDLEGSAFTTRAMLPSGSVSPRDLLSALSRGGGWMALLADRLPKTMADLAAAGVPEEILEELRKLVAEGHGQKAVVGAFLAALSAIAAECGCSRQFVRRLRNQRPKGTDGDLLETRVAKVLAGATPEAWAQVAEG